MGLYVRGRKMWWMSYTVDGRQVFESCHTHNKRLAKRVLDIRLAEILEGRFRMPASKPPFLSEYADQFLETIRHDNTRRTYSSCMKVMKEFFGIARLNQISAVRIEEFKRKRLSEGTGPATINRNLAVLRRMLKLAARERMIARSPFAEVEFLEERKYRKQPHILTFNEQEKLLAVAPPRIRALTVLLTETGLRIGKECLPLLWENIDFQNSTIYVHKSKTAAGQRIIPLSEQCKAELLRWKNLTEFSEFVFPSISNPRHPLQGGRKAWVSALKKAGIPYFPIYNLRHTFASRLNAAGASAITVAQMLGHSGTGIVQTYAKVLDDARRDAIKKLEEYRELRTATAPEGPPKESIN